MKDNFTKFVNETGKALVGYERITEMLLVSLLCKGHLLLEGPPGVAKTTLAKTFSKLVDANFKRIQFTPDLLPTDIVGTVMFNPKTGEFKVRKGPIFTNIILADEINRASPKTQSALLEAMEEKQVTIEGETYPLPEPFIVIATQNPVEQEGTYPLPEAQLDRFLFKVNVNYPKKDEEKEIIRRVATNAGKNLNQVFKKQEIIQLRDVVDRIKVTEPLMDYISSITDKLRSDPVVAWGPSPRASLAMLKVAKAVALSNNRGYATPEDVKKYAIEILQHRIGIKPESEIEGATTEKVVIDVLNEVDAI